MTITYLTIVAIVTYIFASISKIFWNTLPTKYIPIQNVIIAFISALVCYFFKIENSFINALVYSFMGTMGAGGIYDLVKMLKNKSSDN